MIWLTLTLLHQCFSSLVKACRLLGHLSWNPIVIISTFSRHHFCLEFISVLVLSSGVQVEGVPRLLLGFLHVILLGDALRSVAFSNINHVFNLLSWISLRSMQIGFHYISWIACIFAKVEWNIFAKIDCLTHQCLYDYFFCLFLRLFFFFWVVSFFTDLLATFMVINFNTLDGTFSTRLIKPPHSSKGTPSDSIPQRSTLILSKIALIPFTFLLDALSSSRVHACVHIAIVVSFQTQLKNLFGIFLILPGYVKPF